MVLTKFVEELEADELGAAFALAPGGPEDGCAPEGAGGAEEGCAPEGPGGAKDGCAPDLSFISVGGAEDGCTPAFSLDSSGGAEEGCAPVASFVSDSNAARGRTARRVRALSPLCRGLRLIGAVSFLECADFMVRNVGSQCDDFTVRNVGSQRFVDMGRAFLVYDDFPQV